MASITPDYNKLAASYAQTRHTHPDVLKAFVTAANPQDNILEVGCGTGNYIAALSATVNGHTWGMDRSPGMLAKAMARSANSHFYVGNAEAIGLPGDTFNLLFSVDVIHHLPQPQAYLREAYRLLKQGGRLCTVTDSAEIIRRRRPLSTYFPETTASELRRYPPLAHLRAWMIAAGFQEIVEQTVEQQFEVSDLQAYESKAFSALHLISEEAFQRGLRRMKADLQKGPIPGVSRYALLWGVK